jgi:hypothetical protein
MGENSMTLTAESDAYAENISSSTAQSRIFISHSVVDRDPYHDIWSWESLNQLTTQTRRIAMGRAVAEVKRLLELPRGWDGDDAEAVSKSSANTLLWLVAQLLQDGSATPQIAPRPDGGLQAMWLVDGHALVIDALPDDETFLLAEEPGGRRLLDETIYVRRFVSYAAAINLARRFLARISESARFPVPQP